MLQQTQVQTVIPYWHTFLNRFPTIKTLANAPEDELMQAWQGLGYYRRARYMQNAAQEIVKSHKGQLPKTQEELIKLPGFGPYTSGAVASIAFKQNVPCIDGNVTRVLSRILATHELTKINAMAFDLAQNCDVASLNQSLMELGALVCTSKNPACLSCPVQDTCLAYKNDSIKAYPAPKKRIKIQNIYAAILVLYDPKKQAYLLQKRPSTGRWAGLWEFPYFEWLEKKTPATHISSFKEIFPEAGHIVFQSQISHKLTHQAISVDIYKASGTSSTLKDNQQWSTDISKQPTSVLTQKINQKL